LSKPKELAESSASAPDLVGRVIIIDVAGHLPLVASEQQTSQGELYNCRLLLRVIRADFTSPDHSAGTIRKQTRKIAHPALAIRILVGLTVGPRSPSAVIDVSGPPKMLPIFG
jgi:hypothetical protein